MNGESGLTGPERLNLHEIQAELARVRSRLQRRIGNVATRQLFEQFRLAIHLYEDVMGRPRKRATFVSDPDLQALHKLAHEALGELGGQAEPKLVTLKDYDNKRFGPFLGVSDEGSAADQICTAAYADPKCAAFKTRDPMVIGLALDAERLGAIGEVAVGPDEYQRIRVDVVQRLLTTTNVGTRVNIRHYRNRPVVAVPPEAPKLAVAHAVQKIGESMRPFWDTPGGAPRPVTVLVAFVGRSHEAWQKRVLLGILHEMGKESRRNPVLHQLGLQQKVPSGKPGVLAVKRTIDMAVSCGIHGVAIEGVQRPQAERTISAPGLLNYFPPGLLQEILDYSSKRSVRVEPWKIVDTETTARNIWMGLSTARHMGLELGKYGLVPLTYEEQEAVIGRIQNWFGNWCAAPVHYVDLPGLDAHRVYTEKTAVNSTARWLELVARCGVPVVLIDTAEKSKGKRLMKRGRSDSMGVFSFTEIAELNNTAHRMGLKVLWAGGLDSEQAYQLGELGVFGLYVTSAAADTRAVTDDYADDPMLAALKEPSFDKVLRTKVLTEAGFLATRMAEVGRRTEACRIQKLARSLLKVRANGERLLRRQQRTLERLLVKCWRLLDTKPPREVTIAPRLQ